MSVRKVEACRRCWLTFHLLMGLIFYSLVRFKHKNTRELDKTLKCSVKVIKDYK